MSDSSPFKVSIRLIDNGSSLLAKADITGSKLTINGFSVMAGKDGKEPWIAEPSIKQGSGWLKIVEIFDKPTKDVITKAVLAAYDKAVADRGEVSTDDDREIAF